MQDIAILASRVLTTQKQFTAVADNVANVNTPGFRKLELDFRESISKPKGNATASYVADRAFYIDTQNGSLQNTGNPLDVALSGEGYFAVDVNGSTQYTRKGQFTMNSEGILVTQEGNPVLDNSGAQIQIPQDAKSITISGDGTLSTDQGQLATIGVYGFTPEQQNRFTRAGMTQFLPGSGDVPTVLETPTVRQGFFEASNVNATEEMVNMQTVSRAYENSLTMLKSLEDLEQRAIRNLGTAN